MQGHVVKDGVIFDERIIMGQIVQKRVVQNPVGQGLMVQGRYGKAFTQSRVVEGLLVRTYFSKYLILEKYYWKAVHVVILGVTIAYVL